MVRKLFMLLRNIPFVPDAIQAGTLMGVGDAIAQTFVERKDIWEIDKRRLGSFFLIGTLFVGPPLHFWYGFLHKYITGGSKIVVMKKVMLDQFVFAPCFMGIILTIINCSQGHSAMAILKKLEQDYPDILKNNYKVWPAVQLINFYAIPLKFQVATVQMVAIFWNTYISWKTSKPIEIKSEIITSTGIS